MREQRIKDRKEKHKQFKEAYIAAKKALIPTEEYINVTYD